ncbi:MAG: hypothetical protein GY762_11960 [Proteobacteria bacterium]|nr:hypothetical protein [Pseudomonadota bacterium]
MKSTAFLCGFVIAFVLPGCTMAPMEEGQFACIENGDCPKGWSCNPCDTKCYSNESSFAAACDAGDGTDACVTTEAKSHTQCGTGENVYWFDDCGNENEVQTRCSKTSGLCTNLNDRSAHCACKGNWDIADDCTSCLAGYGDVNGDECNTCVRYVDGSLQLNDDDRDGRTWATAFRTVQEGIDSAETAVASSGLTACEVWVAQGEYNIYGNVLSTVLLKSGVHVFGSFVAETLSRDMRGDWQAHKTILNGQFDGARVYHVVTGSDDTTLDGFVITGGNANSPVPDDNMNIRGGGMLNDDASLRTPCYVTRTDQRPPTPGYEH